jgi:hypothetical protein
MEEDSIEAKIYKTDWGKYLKPEFYDAKEMSFSHAKLISTLIELNSVCDSKMSSNLHRECLNALGNNHRGTYYPATIEAIDIIIEIEKTSKNENPCDCARVILNDLYYFRLEHGSHDIEHFKEVEIVFR